MRAHLNMGSPEVMVCSFRISDLMGPDKPHGGPTATARWQLCPEAGGSLSGSRAPIQVKAGYQPADGKGQFVTAQ